MTTTTLSDFCLWKRNRIIWEPIHTIDQKSNFDFQYKLIFGWLAIDGKLEVQLWIRICIVLRILLLLFWIKLYLAIGSSIPIRRADVFSKAPLPPPLSYPLHFFSQFAKGYWVFSIVLEIQYPSEIERSRAALELLLCKTHRTHQIFSNRYILDKTMEKRKRIWLLPIGHFSAMLKIVL